MSRWLIDKEVCAKTAIKADWQLETTTVLVIILIANGKRFLCQVSIV